VEQVVAVVEPRQFDQQTVRVPLRAAQKRQGKAIRVATQAQLALRKEPFVLRVVAVARVLRARTL
jgi:hypothetical protein